MRIRYTNRARRHLASIRLYVGARNPAAADKVLARIRRSVDLLATFPNLGTAGPRPGLFQLVVPHADYVVVYRIASEPAHIAVLGVFHPARGTRPV